jgi:predicted transposase/invertase (TIGR01784 family)
MRPYLMAKYLDPKSDIVFKKIFGEHPHLLKSFLNAILPLPADGQIETLEYLSCQQIPAIPIIKTPIVDVKCKDQQGKIFIVEMQIEWTNSFMQRLLFGAASAYVKQLSIGETYELLNPVYGLGLIDSIYDKETPEWYHHYGLVKLNNPQKEVIKGLTLVFVELPKFKPSKLIDKKLQVLWLRFMREIGGKTQEVDPSLLAVPEIKEAIHLAEEAAYTPAELEAYEGYWKAVSSERTLLKSRLEEGLAKGKAEGLAEGLVKGKTEGLAEGLVKGKTEGKAEIAKNMKAEGVPISLISKYTGLTVDQIEQL